ncbi:DEAD/DEAH box helicase [Arcanobacterium haemolyticum]|nr:DEAD/DEAH box helicase [Arcanobacterium haemolyticum]
MQGPVELVGIVGAPTYRRGLEYAEESKAELDNIREADPKAPKFSPDDRVDRRTWTSLTGESTGRGGNRYQVEVDVKISKAGVITAMNGECTCPQEHNCKHCVALVVTYLWHRGGRTDAALPNAHATSIGGTTGMGAAGGLGDQNWRSALDTIFRPQVGGAQLALAFTLIEPGGGENSSRTSRFTPRGMTDLGSVGNVEVRPMSQGRRKAWVANDVTWARMQTHQVRDADPIQVEAIERLRQLYVAANPYDMRPNWLRLASIDNPALWPTLRAIVDSGVELIDAATFAPVVLESEPARADIDINDDNAGALTVRAQLTHPNLTEGNNVVRLGRPLHGIAWRDSSIHLAALAAPASAPWLKLASMPAGVKVPPSEREIFERDVLPLISRVGWVSAKETYKPHTSTSNEMGLHLGIGMIQRVKPGEPPRARVHWSWGEQIDALTGMLSRDNERAAVRELATSSSLAGMSSDMGAMVELIERENSQDRAPQSFGSPVPPLTPNRYDSRRDPQEEKALLARVATIAADLPALLDPDAGIPGHVEIRQDVVLHGLDVVTLLDDLCPQFERYGVTINRLGEIPDFRQASAPVLSVGATERTSSGRDWFDLDLDMSVDGHHVPMPVLIAALVGGEDAVFLDTGEYVRLDTPELERLRSLVAEARALVDRPRSGIRVPKVRRSWWEDLLSLEIVQAQTNAWFDAVRDAVANPPEPAPIPDGLVATLRPYQVAGYQWLAGLRRSGLGGVLADDMGLGKTVQTLAMIQDDVNRHHGKNEQEIRRPGRGRTTKPEESHDRTERGPWIVVAPTSVVSNWAAEAKKFTPNLAVVTVDATRKRRGVELGEYVRGADIVVTSYTLLRLETDAYAALAPTGMILDEAQQAKNPTSKTFTSIMRIGAPTFAITGTPMENNLGELWAVFALTAPGLLGSAKQFNEHTRRPIERGDTDAASRMSLLRRRIAPFLLRRTKRDVALDLPDKQEQVLDVELEGAHRRLYDKYLQRERQRVLRLAEDMDRNRVEVLSALTRLRQLAIDPKLVDEESKAPSSKLDALIPLLHEAAGEGHRTLVFSQFTRYLRMIAERLESEGIAYSYLDGGTTNRADVIDGFATGDAPVFLISLKAGGVGLNLTMADYVILTDPWWNPAAEEQAVDRTHRIGQKNSVHVYRMVSRDTIEDKVVALQDAKRQLVADVLANDEAVPDGAAATPATGGSRLTAEDLRMLLA